MDKEELLFALRSLEAEKNIKKETLVEAIQASILNACKQYYGQVYCPFFKFIDFNLSANVPLSARTQAHKAQGLY